MASISRLVSMGLMLVTGGVLLTQCQQKEVATPMNVPSESPRAVAACLGRIEPRSRIRKVAPPDFLTNPRLEALSVGIGDQVQEGQLLGWFAGRGKSLADVAVAQANLAHAQAELKLVLAGAKPATVAAGREQLTAARLQDGWAQSELARAQQLLARNATTQEDLAMKRHQADQAHQQVLRLEQELRATAEVRDEDVALAQAALQLAQAQSQRAQADVQLQEIRAPISGKVLDVRVWPGEAADAAGVLDLADVTAMDVVAEVFETDAMAVQLGQSAEVIVPGVAERLRGAVSLLGHMIKKKSSIEQDPVADIDARVIEMRIALDDVSAQKVQRLVHQQVQVIIASPQADTTR